MERDDIGFATREGHYVAMKRIIPPVGEARDDYAIFGDLAVRLGVAETFTEDRDTAAWLEHIYDASRAKAAGMDLVLPTFVPFWVPGLIWLAAHDAPVVLLAALPAAPAANPPHPPPARPR